MVFGQSKLGCCDLQAFLYSRKIKRPWVKARNNGSHGLSHFQRAKQQAIAKTIIRSQKCFVWQRHRSFGQVFMAEEGSHDQHGNGGRGWQHQQAPKPFQVEWVPPSAQCPGAAARSISSPMAEGNFPNSSLGEAMLPSVGNSLLLIARPFDFGFSLSGVNPCS